MRVRRATRVVLITVLAAALAGGVIFAVRVIQLSQRHEQVEAAVKGSFPAIPGGGGPQYPAPAGD
jgi:hypothetical protein